MRLALILAALVVGGGCAQAMSVAPPAVPTEYAAYAPQIAEAQLVLDEFMAAFNGRDIKAWEGTFNFPHVRFASNAVTIIHAGDMKPEMLTTGSLKEWDHSEWARRDVISAGPDKVHINTRFNRYRKDGTLLGGFDSIYIITRLKGHWGVQGRSSFAP